MMTFIKAWLLGPVWVVAEIEKHQRSRRARNYE